jgi:hypothetical protein
VGGWLEELELKQALQFSFGLGLCKRNFHLLKVIIHSSKTKHKTISAFFISSLNNFKVWKVGTSLCGGFPPTGISRPVLEDNNG